MLRKLVNEGESHMQTVGDSMGTLSNDGVSVVAGYEGSDHYRRLGYRPHASAVFDFDLMWQITGATSTGLVRIAGEIQ